MEDGTQTWTQTNRKGMNRGRRMLRRLRRLLTIPREEEMEKERDGGQIWRRKRKTRTQT